MVCPYCGQVCIISAEANYKIPYHDIASAHNQVILLFVYCVCKTRSSSPPWKLKLLGDQGTALFLDVLPYSVGSSPAHLAPSLMLPLHLTSFHLLFLFQFYSRPALGFRPVQSIPSIHAGYLG